MRRYILVPLILGLLTGAAGRAVAQVAGAAGCPATTETENVAIARAWHEEVINRRNPAVLSRTSSPPRSSTTRPAATRRSWTRPASPP